MTHLTSKLLNVGCGFRVHPAWTNVDIASTVSGVLVCDLTKGIPFPDCSYDLVYHSHVLEHIPREAADQFLSECARVLKPEGILRIAVPDLEVIARFYLASLKELDESNSDLAVANHQWMMIELLDQMVRTSPGGQMGAYLCGDDLKNKEFVLGRLGSEARKAFDRESVAPSSAPTMSGLVRRTFERLHRFCSSAPHRREVLARRILGEEYRALQLGRFRLAGEVHQWMYDRRSLERALLVQGLQGIVVRGPAESYFPGWAEFHLDTEPDGSTYKPDSLYMEARRPG